MAIRKDALSSEPLTDRNMTTSLKAFTDAWEKNMAEDPLLARRCLTIPGTGIAEARSPSVRTSK